MASSMCQCYSRSRIPSPLPLHCLQDLRNVKHLVIIVNWCLDPAGDPAPALSLSTSSSLVLSPNTNKLTNWQGDSAGHLILPGPTKEIRRSGDGTEMRDQTGRRRPVTWHARLSCLLLTSFLLVQSCSSLVKKAGGGTGVILTS